jgi:hypothetical protein
VNRESGVDIQSLECTYHLRIGSRRDCCEPAPCLHPESIISSSAVSVLSSSLILGVYSGPPSRTLTNRLKVRRQINHNYASVVGEENHCDLLILAFLIWLKWVSSNASIAFLFLSKFPPPPPKFHNKFQIGVLLDFQHSHIQTKVGGKPTDTYREMSRVLFDYLSLAPNKFPQ